MPVPSAKPVARAENRIPELDGIRGLAILLVVIGHFGTPFSPSAQVTRLISFGWAGVDLFFVLSGFLITGILLASTNSRGYFRRFYVRRAFRIFPVYYAFLILFFHAGDLFRLIPRGTGPEWWYWLYLSNWSPFEARNRNLEHFWSLCVEEQFYLFFPLVVRYCSRRTLKTVCLGVVVLSPLLRLVSAESGESPYRLYQETVFRLDGLALGAILALARDDAALRGAIQRWSGAIAVAAVAVFALVLWRYGPNFVSEPMTVLGHTAVSLVSALLIFHAARFSWTLRVGWLQALGRYSYPMYVWHFPIALRLAATAKNFHGRFNGGGMWLLFTGCVLAGLGASYVVALISWYVLEKPCARLKDRLTRPVAAERKIPIAEHLQETGAT